MGRRRPRFCRCHELTRACGRLTPSDSSVPEGWGGGGIANDQIGVDDDLPGHGFACDLPEERPGGEDAHIVQGLANRGEGGVLKGS